MEARNNLPMANEATFKIIYSIIMQDSKKRKEFFSNPEKVLDEKGIKLDKKILELLKKIGNLNIDSNSSEFNEKLVLCSSSGY